jgi:hypothetical protein
MHHSNVIWTFGRYGICSAALRPNFLEKGFGMRKTLMAAATVATLAIAAVATPAQAQRGVGAGIAAGLIGGAIVGGAMPLEEVRAGIRMAASLMGTLGAVTSFIGAG